MSVLNNWQTAESCTFLLNEEVHIWKFNLILPPDTYENLRDIMSPDEIIRADRFYFEKDRNRFIAARGQLRKLLGRYIGKNARDLVFRYGKYGKPYLTDSLVQFNISHSHELGLAAFDAAENVGIDIEWQRPDFGGIKIARRFFSEEEVTELEGLPEANRLQGFFNGWSRKEAYIKARGKGLSIPLNKFSVSLAPDKPALIRHTGHDPDAVNKYALHNISSNAAYCSAIVTHKRRNNFQLFKLTPNFDED